MARSSPAKARKRLSKDERRTRILDAAARLFGEHGYDAASIDEIADRAGITKPVIYDHFTSKSALYISLGSLYEAELLAFMGARALAEGSAEGRMAAAFDAVFEFAEAHPDAWRILFRDAPPSDPEIVDAYRRLQERATGAIVMLFAAGDTAEHPADPSGYELVVEREMAAELLKQAANGLASWWYAHREIPREHLLYVMMNALWIGFERFTMGERWQPEGATREEGG
jgi:AcrR family transcriptional regulator